MVVLHEIEHNKNSQECVWAPRDSPLGRGLQGQYQQVALSPGVYPEHCSNGHREYFRANG